jgi:hypothetical protein
MKRLSNLIIKYKNIKDKACLNRFKIFKRDGGEIRPRTFPSYYILNYIDQHRISYQWLNIETDFHYKFGMEIKYRYKGLDMRSKEKILKDIYEDEDVHEEEDDYEYNHKSTLNLKQFKYSKYFDSYDLMSMDDYINISSCYDNHINDKKKLFFFETEFKNRYKNFQFMFKFYYLPWLSLIDSFKEINIYQSKSLLDLENILYKKIDRKKILFLINKYNRYKLILKEDQISIKRGSHFLNNIHRPRKKYKLRTDRKKINMDIFDDDNYTVKNMIVDIDDVLPEEWNNYLKEEKEEIETEDEDEAEYCTQRKELRFTEDGAKLKRYDYLKDRKARNNLDFTRKSRFLKYNMNDPVVNRYEPRKFKSWEGSNRYQVIAQSLKIWYKYSTQYLLDTRSKSRVIHGHIGFLGYNTSFISNDDPGILPRCIVNSDNVPLLLKKQWPKSKLKSKKQENYFQFLEIRDQFFRYYYLDDGASLKYEVIDFEQIKEDEWIWRYLRSCEWYFEGSIKQLYHRIWMHDIFACDPGYYSIDYYLRKDFIQPFKFITFLAIFLITMFFGSICLKEYWTYGTLQVMRSHTLFDMEKNFYPRHNTNVTKAYRWFLDDYPTYLNISQGTYMKPYSLIIHPTTYKYALNKYNLNTHSYLMIDPIDFGRGWGGYKLYEPNTYTMDIFRIKSQFFKKKDWFIFNHENRYKWDGYIKRSRLTRTSSCFDIFNNRRGSYVYVKNRSTNTWVGSNRYNIVDGQIKSIKGKPYFDLIGSIYRGLAWRLGGDSEEWNKGWVTGSPDINHDEYTADYPNEFPKGSWEKYYMIAKDTFSWEFHHYANYAFQNNITPSRDFRGERIRPIKYNPFKPVNISDDYIFGKKEISDRWLNPPSQTALFRILNFRTLKYLPYHEKPGLADLSLPSNYTKKLVKLGYDISNNGIYNNTSIPKFLRYRKIKGYPINYLYSTYKYTILSKYNDFDRDHEHPGMHPNDVFPHFYEYWKPRCKHSRWQDYIEIKPFFTYMANYDLNKLNLIHTNLPYYAMPNIDDDKVYLLEQYIRPKTRKKIKKATFKLLNPIKFCERAFPSYGVAEKFKNICIFDDMADGIIFKSAKYSPYYWPKAIRLIMYLESGPTIMLPIPNPDPYGYVEAYRYEWSLKAFWADTQITTKDNWFRKSPHKYADIFLNNQRDYLKLRTRLLSDSNRSKICMRKILKLYEEDYYNII